MSQTNSWKLLAVVIAETGLIWMMATEARNALEMSFAGNVKRPKKKINHTLTPTGDTNKSMEEQSELFETVLTETKGAEFSDCGKHRYALWRIWDDSKPLVMFIGLNPSTADASTDDATIGSVRRLSKFNGYGGFYMMNCWSFIATEPKDLDTSDGVVENSIWLNRVFKKCQDVVFAWGNFQIISDHQRDTRLMEKFPNALCITKNKNGSPGHPLYKKGTITFSKF